MLTDGTLTEWEQKRTERIKNGYGMDGEQIWNRYGADMERERERLWNGNNVFCQGVPC